MYTTDKSMMRRYEQFSQKFPDHCRLVKEDQYSMTFTIDPVCMGFKPKAPRQGPAQRACTYYSLIIWSVSEYAGEDLHLTWHDSMATKCHSPNDHSIPLPPCLTKPASTYSATAFKWLTESNGKLSPIVATIKLVTNIENQTPY